MRQQVFTHFIECSSCPHYRKYRDSRWAYLTCKDCPQNQSSALSPDTDEEVRRRG